MQVLSIVAVIDSSVQNRGWKDAIRAVTRRVAAARGNAESPLNLNVVFHVSGRMLKPEFEGVRTGRFSQADRHLMVQVAVPEEVPDDPEMFLWDGVRAAIDEA